MQGLLMRALSYAFVAGASYAVGMMSRVLKEMQQAAAEGRDASEVVSYPAGIDRELLNMAAKQFAERTVEQLWKSGGDDAYDKRPWQPQV